jgi:hypothetical protein
MPAHADSCVVLAQKIRLSGAYNFERIALARGALPAVHKQLRLQFTAVVV